MSKGIDTPPGRQSSEWASSPKMNGVGRQARGKGAEVPDLLYQLSHTPFRASSSENGTSALPRFPCPTSPDGLRDFRCGLASTSLSIAADRAPGSVRCSGA